MDLAGKDENERGNEKTGKVRQDSTFYGIGPRSCKSLTWSVLINRCIHGPESYLMIRQASCHCV